MKEKYLTLLDDKVIVITGASSGVGRAAALEFAKHKAILILAARNENALSNIAAECESFGSEVITVKTDVTHANAVQQLADTAISFAGKIDVWINNAGVLAAGELAETPVEIHTQVIRTNLIGYLHGAHAVLPYFKQQKYGVLINNISIGGWFPVPYATGYSASKFGIRGFSEALRGELIKYPGIFICDLYPAFLDTPGIQHAANYTGSALKPAPPLYDPLRVAKTMVKIAINPKNSLTIGGITPLLKLAHFISPSFTRRMTALVMSAYFKHADPSPGTSGNLFEPVEYGTSIHGGWNSHADIAVRKKRITSAAILAAGIGVGLYIFSKKK